LARKPKGTAIERVATTEARQDERRRRIPTKFAELAARFDAAVVSSDGSLLTVDEIVGLWEAIVDADKSL
jgi:hypothetical protein